MNQKSVVPRTTRFNRSARLSFEQTDMCSLRIFRTNVEFLICWKDSCVAPLVWLQPQYSTLL